MKIFSSCNAIYIYLISLGWQNISDLQQPFLPRQKTSSQNDSDKLYVTLCRNIMFYFRIKHPSRFCDMHSFSPSFLVMGRVFPPIVFLISHASYLSLPCLPFWMTKKLCFPPTSEAYRHLSIHSQRSGGKEGSAWKKNMQFEELWQRTHFWSYLRCNLNNLSDPLPLISCHPGEGEKVQWASQDVSARSSVDVENSSAHSGKQQRYSRWVILLNGYLIWVKNIFKNE